MNTLISVSIYPMGVEGSLSAHVSEVVKVIESSGLPSRTTSMSTEIEGEWDEVMKVVKEATFVSTHSFLQVACLRCSCCITYT